MCQRTMRSLSGGGAAVRLTGHNLTQGLATLGQRNAVGALMGDAPELVVDAWASRELRLRNRARRE